MSRPEVSLDEDFWPLVHRLAHGDSHRVIQALNVFAQDPGRPNLQPKVLRGRLGQRMSVRADRDMPYERGDTAAAVLTRAVAWFAAHGITVERVLTDNGSCYRSRVFRRAADAGGVRLKKTRARRPQTDGKVERFNLTLKREWTWQRVYADNTERAPWPWDRLCTATTTTALTGR